MEKLQATLKIVNPLLGQVTFVSLFRQINAYINHLLDRAGITATATFTLKLNFYIRINVHVLYSLFNCTIFIVLFL